MGDIPVFPTVHKSTTTYHAVPKMSYYQRQQIDSSPITRGSRSIGKGINQFIGIPHTTRREEITLWNKPLGSCRWE